MTTNADKLPLRRGCTDDFYNDRNPLGVKKCWSLESAKPVVRFRLGWWTDPTKHGAFVEIVTLSCRRAPGKYAHCERLPAHAVEPVRLAELPDSVAAAVVDAESPF